MKKIIALLLAAVMVLGLAACGQKAPTAPETQAADANTDAAATVSRAPAHFTPHKCLTVDDTGIIGFYHAKGQQYSLRQKIPAYYYRNGICYALKRHTLLEKGTIIEKSCKAVVIERPVVNIDDEHELAYAEFLFLKDNR